jgi:hypothetical protein
VFEDSVHDDDDENAGIEVYDEFSENGTLNVYGVLLSDAKV